ncbi:hypothetical protein DdX_08403 [Ditylenchus destructor]|uniref:Uncharacterized protein n=1 Tax=Ditylenchus destructor TaxID=166010 RepID=A0AAD4N7M8_9BILA|nr:hypothetical protein DdX_08403 [Ditylenchus destructor]
MTKNCFIVDTRIISNPTFTWTMNPPVQWTYPEQNAIQLGSNLPGQPITQIDAQNNANGAITASVLEALNNLAIPTTGVRVIPTYTPPMVNDCQKASTATGTQIGQQFGIVEQGAVIYLASSTAVISQANCQARSFLPTTNPLTLTSFVQSASAQVQGVTGSVFQFQQVAQQMMVYLNFNSRVRFVTEVMVS